MPSDTQDVTRAHLDQHVHPRLRRRVRMYLGISVAIIIAIVYRIAVHGGGLIYPLAALAVGITIGILLSACSMCPGTRTRKSRLAHRHIRDYPACGVYSIRSDGGIFHTPVVRRAGGPDRHIVSRRWSRLGARHRNGQKDVPYSEGAYMIRETP